MSSKLKIILYIVIFLMCLIIIKLLVFPIYTRCSGNNCKVIHLNRITGNSYYTNVEHKSTKSIKGKNYKKLKPIDDIDCKQYEKSGTFDLDMYMKCTP